MSKIWVKNFGPIKEGFQDQWIDIKKVTLFIGNQGTGKSTITKLISTFTWMEKALTRGDYTIDRFQRKDVFRNYLDYHGISSYLKGSPYDSLNSPKATPVSEIEYIGDSYAIKYDGRHLIIKKTESDNYHLPQIMYVPSERNYLSSTTDPKQQRQISAPLIELLAEMEMAIEELGEYPIKLPINNVSLGFDEDKEVPYIAGHDYKINLVNASSGFHSIVPLYVVSRYLANSVKHASENPEQMNSSELARLRRDITEIHDNPNFTDEQKRIAISALAYKYNKTAFINIVEEPEQNLFPTSQWEVLKSLLDFNNMNPGNKLIMTSHSPYIINYLTLVVKAASVLQKIVEYGSTHPEKESELLSLLEQIVPVKSVLSAEDLVIYELDDNGNIIKLPDYKGLPSDENYLNEMLGKSNDLFSKLLDIEDLCR